MKRKLIQKIKHTDLKSREGDIGQFKKYLTKVFGMILKDSKILIDEIIKHKIVRNKITHESGLVEHQGYTKIKNLTGLKFESFGDKHQILIDTPEYLLNLVKKMEEFFKILLIEVDEHIKVRRSNRVE